MSFTDKVKHISQFAIIDEFCGRGAADKISRFYIVLRVTDENGNPLQITSDEVKEAIQKVKPNIVLADYLGNNEYTMEMWSDNPGVCDFLILGNQYRNNVNIMGVDVWKFRASASLCVKIRSDDGSEMASTTYLSDFPSCFFLNRKTTGN